jgi:hypothetical protein
VFALVTAGGWRCCCHPSRDVLFDGFDQHHVAPFVEAFFMALELRVAGDFAALDKGVPVLPRAIEHATHTPEGNDETLIERRFRPLRARPAGFHGVCRHTCSYITAIVAAQQEMQMKIVLRKNSDTATIMVGERIIVAFTCRTFGHT